MPSVSIPNGLYDYARSLSSYGIGTTVGEVKGCCAAIWPDNHIPDSLWVEKVFTAKIPVIHTPRTPVEDRFIRYEVGVSTNDVSHLVRIISRIIDDFANCNYSQCKVPKEPPKQVAQVINKTPAEIKEEKEFEPLPVNIHDGEFISICVSLKNRAFYMEGLCENLYAQEYDLKKVELCIADEGSKDNIIEVLQKHASKFAQIKYMKLDRSQATDVVVKGNHHGLDINAIVTRMATFEKIIHLDPEIRLSHIGTLRRISSALDKKDMVILVPCQKLAEGVEWRPNPQYGTHEIFGSAITTDGFYCVGFNKNHFIETGGIEEKLFGGNSDEFAYFHHWHRKHSTWNAVRNEFTCYHLYHAPTRNALKPEAIGKGTLLQKLMNKCDRANYISDYSDNMDWTKRPILSDLNIWHNGNMPAVSVVIPYMFSKYRSRVLKYVLQELRKCQTVKNIEIIVSEVGVARKAGKFQFPDQKLYNRTAKWVKGEAVSWGVVEANSDFIVMWDADIISSPIFMECLCAERAKGWHSMQLGGDLYKLTEKGIVDITQFNSKGKMSVWEAFYAFEMDKKIGDTGANQYGRTYPTYPGGVVAFYKDLYISIGGISERYVGWGYEDKLFQDILDYASPKHLRRPDMPLVHIYHPESTEKDDKNSKLYDEDRQATLPKVIKTNKGYFKDKYLSDKGEK